MDEKKIWDMLKEDAGQIEIPQELQPQQIETMLESVKQLQNTWDDEETEKTMKEQVVVQTQEAHRGKSKKQGQRRGIRRYTRQIAAAAAAVVCIGGAYGASRMIQMSGEDNADMEVSEEKTAVYSTEEEWNTEEVYQGPHISVASLGDMYTRAEDYGEVYDSLYEQQKEDITFRDVLNGIADVAGDFIYKSEDDMVIWDAEGVVEDSVASAEPGASGTDYSKTNLMTAGVDESDIVKTDGKYIYKVENNHISVTDIRGGEMKEVALVAPPSQSAADEIREIYVDEERLLVITQREDVNMDVGQIDMEEITVAEDAMVDVYEMAGKVQTVTYIYDIANPAEPKQEDSVIQDGRYHTSRKIGDILYVFTDYMLNLPDENRKSAIAEDGVTAWLPGVEDTAVPAECIYLPETGYSGLFVSSVDITKPDNIIDMKMIVNDYSSIYVSNSSIYIYKTDYRSNPEYTKIARFAMKDGVIEGVDAATVNGSILDSFAINEYQGYLRVLTTVRGNREESNSVYILDADMHLAGELEGIAPGEQIYSARFMNETGYFVTYRNTDPLFTVDLSNPKAPKILGELKVTGFSEYLHFWGEDKLLGIGYETDPDTGEDLGIKLSMFDISDPANVKEESRTVLEGDVYTDALYNYKSILVDKEKNIIGFAFEDYAAYNWEETDDYGYGIRYTVYSYENGQFVQKLNEQMSDYLTENCRGLYVKDIFYLMGDNSLESFDMQNGYQKRNQDWVRLEE